MSATKKGAGSGKVQKLPKRGRDISLIGKGGREGLSAAMEKLFATCEAKLGHVPNVFQVLAKKPEHLEVFVAMNRTLMTGESKLTPLEREMIAVVTSSANRCYYCLASHGWAVRKLSGDAALGDQIVLDYRKAALSERVRAMLDFAWKLAEEPQKMEASDVEGLREQGLDDESILDVVQVASFYNYTNRVAHALEVLPNEEYLHEHRGG